MIGLFGSNEGLPNDPDGIFQPPPKPRCYELLIKQAAERLNITLHPDPAFDPHAAAERPAGVSLLRPVRPRLRRRTRTSRRRRCCCRRRSRPTA